MASCWNIYFPFLRFLHALAPLPSQEPFIGSDFESFIVFLSVQSSIGISVILPFPLSLKEKYFHSYLFSPVSVQSNPKFWEEGLALYRVVYTSDSAWYLTKVQRPKYGFLCIAWAETLSIKSATEMLQRRTEMLWVTDFSEDCMGKVSLPALLLITTLCWCSWGSVNVCLSKLRVFQALFCLLPSQSSLLRERCCSKRSLVFLQCKRFQRALWKLRSNVSHETHLPHTSLCELINHNILSRKRTPFSLNLAFSVQLYLNINH